MDKNSFIDLATNSSLANVISVLRTATIENLQDQSHLLETLELMEEEREDDDPICLLHSPHGNLEAHFSIPKEDALALIEEGCQIIKICS